MEGGGKQSRLLGRLLGKLRGEHRTLDKNFSFCSTGISETVCCASGTEEDMDTSSTQATTSNTTIDDAQFAAKLDLRYGGQYLTAEQLPEFCNQLHHLVEVIRNIQSYAQVTGEYPAELESRLEREAREVAALAGEAKNARDVCARVTTQRNALHLERGQLVAQLAKMREVEMRELESTVRQCDRKLYKSYEAVRDSTDVNAFEPLLDEIRTKQAALEGLERLIENKRKSILTRKPTHALPLPAHEDGPHSSSRKRHDSRRSNKRRRKEVREPRSVPLSGEPSAHEPQQVTLYIQGSANSSTGSRLRAGSAAAVTLGSLELPSRGSVRDILFFTTNSTL
ncbi:uncharacterized protein LOC123714172 isoform X1 [Pieris brassicae]|uniref:uncharacterized protein LOC123714172 isoform X1 n=1 Tax=Pieris brassicae TaxID=7116 RepID=UPI001E65EF6D|nr:uncharacterized protein LOC123714172 isoform X1 [Pieris brassicae]